MRLIEYTKGYYVNADTITHIQYHVGNEYVVIQVGSGEDSEIHKVLPPYAANFRAECCCAYSPHNLPENPNLVCLKMKAERDTLAARLDDELREKAEMQPHYDAIAAELAAMKKAAHPALTK